MFKSGNGGSMDGIPALGADLAVITSSTGVLTTSITTSLELSYLSGVTSNVQTQLNGLQTQINTKQPTGNYITALTGDVVANGPGSVAATIQPGVVTNAMLAGNIAQNKMAAVTASRALVSDASGFYTVSATTSVELGYLSGVTSSVQTQINGKMTNPMTTGGDVIYGGASGVPTRLANGSVGQVLTSAGGTSAPTWQTPKTGVPTIQRLTSGSGLTYTTPAGCTWLRIRMVGAGGGASSTGTASTSAGGAGAATNWDSSTLIAGGGGGGQISGGTPNGFAGGTGGTNTVGGSYVILANIAGSQGGAGSGTLASNIAGGQGGASYFGGQGGSNIGTSAGRNAAVNSGSGGGAAGSTSGNTSGAGGGSGGYVEAIISSPAASYVYTVGAKGNGATAGTGGVAGGDGGSGLIIVEEYYN